MGKVYLIGAGSGDPELLTLKGKRILEQADVVVFDRLVNEEILAMAPSKAKLVNVGKNVGDHPVPQWRINEILDEEYKEDKIIVRLKGGDSFVFGRGGEELLYLKKHGVPFEVVPGITSAIAAATYAGIPVTHRDYCSSLHIITGHRKEDGTLWMDYEALSRLGGTLVFMMSVSSIGTITDGLLQAGMSPDTPCAIIENGTLPEQRKLLSSLGRLQADKNEAQIKSPAVFVVGRVCELSQQLDWFDALPLKGKRILVTRPRAGAQRFAGMLRSLGAQVAVLPAIETKELPFIMPDLSSYTTLVFTSPTGVNVFFERLFKTADARAIHGKRLAVVGRETAKELRKYGLKADIMPRIFSGEALGHLLAQAGTLSENEKLLLLRSKIALPHLEEILKEADIAFHSVDIYDTCAQPMEKLCLADYDCVTLTSVSCATALKAAAEKQEETLRNTLAVCIGEQTQAAAKALEMNTVMADEATLDGMVNALLVLFGNKEA